MAWKPAWDAPREQLLTFLKPKLKPLFWIPFWPSESGMELEYWKGLLFTVCSSWFSSGFSSRFSGRFLGENFGHVNWPPDPISQLISVTSHNTKRSPERAVAHDADDGDRAEHVPRAHEAAGRVRARPRDPRRGQEAAPQPVSLHHQGIIYHSKITKLKSKKINNITIFRYKVTNSNITIS